MILTVLIGDLISMFTTRFTTWQHQPTMATIARTGAIAIMPGNCDRDTKQNPITAALIEGGDSR